MSPELSEGLPARYFDGNSARAHDVALLLQGQTLRIRGAGVDRTVALADVQWPERQTHALRMAHFKGGGSVQCQDSAAWDAWARAGGQGESAVVRLQQSWRWTLTSVAALVALLVVMQQWGMPWVARAVVAAVPTAVEVQIADSVLPLLDQHLMRPSKLSAQEQERMQAAFAVALRAADTGVQPGGDKPQWRLLFRQSRIGPNALALPGGTLILTDEMVQLVERDADVITGVLAHEIGHVRQRHGLRMLVQVTLLSGVSALVLGDFSSVLATAPVLLGQASYSREAEREADQEAVRILNAAGISPSVMATLFDRLAQVRKGKAKGESDKEAVGNSSWLGIAFASHPPDEERIRFFKDAAARR